MTLYLFSSTLHLVHREQTNNRYTPIHISATCSTYTHSLIHVRFLSIVDANGRAFVLNFNILPTFSHKATSRIRTRYSTLQYIFIDLVCWKHGGFFPDTDDNTWSIPHFRAIHVSLDWHMFVTSETLLYYGQECRNLHPWLRYTKSRFVRVWIHLPLQTNTFLVVSFKTYTSRVKSVPTVRYFCIY